MSSEPQVAHAEPAPDTSITHVMYLLHTLAPFTAWLLAPIAIIMGMVTRDRVRGTYLDSHYSWLSRTFWWGLLWIVVSGIITGILFITIIGILIWWLPWVVLFVWYLYRVIRGWMNLADRKEMPA
jgi:uncharacterized membrane protein